MWNLVSQEDNRSVFSRCFLKKKTKWKLMNPKWYSDLSDSIWMVSFLTWSCVGRLSNLCWDSFTTFISWFENQLSSDRLVQPTNTNRETDFTDLLPFFFYKITKTAGNYLLLWNKHLYCHVQLDSKLKPWRLEFGFEDFFQFDKFLFPQPRDVVVVAW